MRFTEAGTNPFCSLHEYTSVQHIVMNHVELKKGSAELMILSLIEDQSRHGYDICKLI